MITLEKLKTATINISGEEFVIEKALDGQYFQLKNKLTGYIFKELSFMCLYEIVKNKVAFEYADKKILFYKIKNNTIYLVKIDSLKNL